MNWFFINRSQFAPNVFARKNFRREHNFRQKFRSAKLLPETQFTNYIDIYLIHIHEPLTPLEETAAALQHLIEQGKVCYVGFSNLPAWMVARFVSLQEHLGYNKFIVGQMYYSQLWRDLEHELVPGFEALGIGVMGWSPLASGFLTGKYTRDNPTPMGTRQEKFAFPPVDVEKGYNVVDVLKRIAENHDATPAQVALAWTHTKAFMSTLLIGANNMAQLEPNLGAIDLEWVMGNGIYAKVGAKQKHLRRLGNG
jgi:aryl-alcohol dehydrogenase-like predicted oxidoreductase